MHEPLFFSVPPKVSLSGFSEGLQEGGRVVLSCSVTQGDLPTSLTWYKDDRTLDSPRIDGFFIGLSIGNLSLEDEGNYTCVAENPAGSSSASHDFRLLGSSFSFQFLRVTTGRFAGSRRGGWGWEGLLEESV